MLVPWMNRALLAIALLTACSSPPDPAPPLVEDVLDVVEELDAESLDAVEYDTEALADDVADAPDIVVPTGPPKTPLSRWTPAVVGKVLVTADAIGLTAELLGNPPIAVETWAPGVVASSPVGLPAGLLCWDIDGDGLLTLAKEDLDGDGAGTDADCALHPKGASPGAAGVVVALTLADGTCELHAYTLAGHPAWTRSFDVACEQPAESAGGLLLPTADGATGAVRLLDPRTGAERTQIALPGAPVTSPSEIAPGRFAVGLETAVARVGVQGGAAVGLWLAEVNELSPDRPTAVLGAGDGRVAATVWQLGDAADSLGRRLRVLDEDGTSRTIHLPGELYGPPVAAIFGAQWTLVAGGSRWVSGWRAATGAPAFAKDTDLGVVTGLAVTGDGQVMVSETSWTGVPDMAPGAAWRVWSFDPAGTFQPTLLDEVAEAGARWVSSAAVLCDFLVVQVVPDAHAPSARLVKKSCSKGLADAAWARAFGDNGNGGAFAEAVDCSPGPGVAPCAAAEGCVENLECDDQNPCTLDACIAGKCSYKFLPGCCTKASDCDDFDLCTKSVCQSGKCQFVPSGACCESSSECDDGHPCTQDHCEQGFCESLPDPLLDGCCATDADCESLGFCTVGVCGEGAECFQAKIAGCCLYDSECFDGSDCTTDACALGECQYTSLPVGKNGCCETDADCPAQGECTGKCNPLHTCEYPSCDDGDGCTLDACKGAECTHTFVKSEGCCETDADCPFEPGDPCVTSAKCLPTHQCKFDGMQCDDGDPCTEDTCKDGKCLFTPKSECCVADSECPPGEACTTAKCVDSKCTLEPTPGCCTTDADCADADPKSTAVCVESACQETYCDSFVFAAEKLPVDMVFVIDQSTSMTEEIPAVRTYLGDFAAWVTQAGIDYHVVLVAARYKGENALCIEPPLAGENCKDSDTFRQIDKQVGSHEALEVVMDHIGDIEAFMRPQSSRQFVVVSDDASDVPYSAFKFFLDSRPGYDLAVVHAIAGFDTMTCATGLGTDYLTLATLTGGLGIDICSADWTSSFAELGKSAESAGTSFLLTKPAGGALTVTYDGQPFEGYAYDAASNRVELTAPLPPAGNVLVVCYPVK